MDSSSDNAGKGYVPNTKLQTTREAVADDNHMEAGAIRPSQDAQEQHRLRPDPEPKEEPKPNLHSKPCMLCQTPRDVLIRCQIDNTAKWYLICTGKCWQSVSGGKVEGSLDHPHYKYGGMWKNKHEVASAKIKGKAKEKNSRGAYIKSPEHRRWGHNTKGKNRKDKIDIFDAGTVQDNSRSESDDGDFDHESIIDERAEAFETTLDTQKSIK
ncbi:hypothetical protein PVAG01_07807 [Phlyctema vagabunda]|uniref:Uncharacterized protein n=1 Tax=Phlyctema vagabunda TaxID=108571 RepID=A0ABR4PDH8_9HELO